MTVVFLGGERFSCLPSNEVDRIEPPVSGNQLLAINGVVFDDIVGATNVVVLDDAIGVMLTFAKQQDIGLLAFYTKMWP